MKNSNLAMTKTAENYGVAVYDSHRDCIARHFDNFSKSDATEIVNFCNHTLKTIAKNDVQMRGKTFAKIIQVGKKFYAAKEFDVIGGTLSFCSHGFKNEIAACRCAAILELLLGGVQDVSDGDCDENS